MRWVLILGLIGLVLAACTPASEQPATLPEGCDPSYAGADACTMQYDPVCATLADGSEKTMGNECVACTGDEDIVSIRPGECEGMNVNDTGSPVMGVGFTECAEPRPEICTREYRPVCARISGDYDTRGNACDACSDSAVSGYVKGMCEDHLFVVCEETVTGFSAEEYAQENNGICVDECPSEFDPYVTQIGVQLCIPHYGEEEIAGWPACDRSSDICNCVRTTETTTGEQIENSEYRCVPEQYASRMLFRSGQDRLDENGERSVVIA